MMEVQMKKTGILAAVLGAMLLAPGPALSDRDHCPPGQAKKGWCSQGWDRGWDRDRDHNRNWRGDRDRDRWDRRVERERDQAYEEGYRDAMRDAWRVGERIPRDRYRVVPDYRAYGWPALRDGRAYVHSDGRDYLVEMATGIILDVLAR